MIIFAAQNNIYYGTGIYDSEDGLTIETEL